MKKNTVKGMFLAAVLAGSVSAFAQSSPLGPKGRNREGLSQAERQRVFDEERKQLLDIAAAKGWPLTKKGEDGSFAELVRLDDEGGPVYYKTLNANSAITSHANLLYPGGTAGLSLTGAGVNAGIWDGGHTMISHETFQGRAELADSDTSVENDHPTHVAGTMIGAAPGKPQYKGMAYEGHLYVNSWTSDVNEMTTQVPQYNLVVSNHSYGLDATGLPASQDAVFGRYDADSKGFDDIMFSNPTYQAVIAAGNDRDAQTPVGDKGGERDLLSGASVGKNVLTIAAVAQKNIFSSVSPMNIASFSSYGPTDDFRIKPDLADDGVGVYSSVTGGSGNLYAAESGTSMATPGVSGVIMLLQQHYKNLHGQFMNSATLRALLINTADRYKTTGVINVADGPDFRTGYGIINAEKAANALTNGAVAANAKAVVKQLTLLPGQSYTTTIKSDGTSILKAALSWTDKSPVVLTTGAADVIPASGTLLRNDLDIRLVNTNNNAVAFPWALKKSFTTPDGTPASERVDNNVDTTELVEIPAADAAGNTYTLTITHKGSSLTGGKQDFSIVVTGITDYNGTSAVDTVVAPGVFNVWPNPAADYLNLHITSGSSDAAVATVIDMQGRQVAVKQFNGEDSQIAVDFLSAGVYFVKVVQGEKQEVKKVIIK